MKILACDIGFGYTKYIFAKINEHNNTAEIIAKEKFPSAVRFLLDSDGFSMKEHPDFVEYNGKAYNVGSLALISEKGLRIRNSEFLIEHVPVFLTKVFKNLKLNNEKPFLIVIGTPFQEWKRLKSKIIEQAKNFAEEVICIPQAAAASLIVKPNWNFAITVDIGFNTCDIVPLDNNGRILAEEGVSWEKLGVSAVIDEIDNLVKNIFGSYLNSAKLENILIKPKTIKKYFNNLSDEFILNFENKVNSIIQNKFYFINAKIMDRFNTSFDKLILVGGGANLYKKFFKNMYGKKIIIPKNSEFANCIGFLLYGLSFIDFKGKILWEKEQKEEVKEEKNNNQEIKKSSEN